MAAVADGAMGALTCWLMTMVTMALELMRATISRVTPELVFEIVLAKTELPPDCTPEATPCEERVGTCVPTFMVAGMLSVAMTLGAEMTRDFPRLSAAVST